MFIECSRLWECPLPHKNNYEVLIWFKKIEAGSDLANNQSPQINDAGTWDMLLNIQV